MAGELALLVIIVAAVALFAVEIWAVRHHIPTISEDAQRFNAAIGIQLLAGITAVIFFMLGWFTAHFTSLPPGG
jgi:hypothetical protein